MKNIRMSAVKVTEFIREKINHQDGEPYEVVCVEWFFDDKAEAVARLNEINSRKPFFPPFLTYVYGVYNGGEK